MIIIERDAYKSIQVSKHLTILLIIFHCYISVCLLMMNKEDKYLWLPLQNTCHISNILTYNLKFLISIIWLTKLHSQNVSISSSNNYICEGFIQIIQRKWSVINLMYLSITILKLQYSHGKWITKLFNGLSFERKSWNKK